jgi:hypothetical protein
MSRMKHNDKLQSETVTSAKNDARHQVMRSSTVTGGMWHLHPGGRDLLETVSVGQINKRTSVNHDLVAKT